MMQYAPFHIAFLRLRQIGLGFLLTMMSVAPACAEAPWLPQILSDLHLPRLSWGMRMERVARALPEAARSEHPCAGAKVSRQRCLDLQLPTWRFGELAGELRLESRRGQLMTIGFEGVVKTRAEEEAIVHRLHELYGLPETRGTATGPLDRQVQARLRDTFFEYDADEKADGIHYAISFKDQRHVIWVHDDLVSAEEYEALAREEARHNQHKPH